MGEIQYPYQKQNVVQATPLHEDLFNKIDGQVEGLTERFGGTWTDATRPTVSVGVPHPAGWNDDRKCYEYWNGVAWLQFSAGGGPGPTPPIRIYTCPSAIVVGEWLAKDGNPNTVVLADASNKALPALGACKQKLTSTTCDVQRIGELGVFSGLIPGSVYYLDRLAGKMTLPPIDLSLSGLIQRVGVAKNSTTLEVDLGPAREVG